MLKCKRCNQTLTKFDKDLCPYCGMVKPLEGQQSNTEDITQFIDTEIKNNNEMDYKIVNTKLSSFLLMFLGIFSAHLFYCKKVLKGIFLLISNLLFIGIGGYLLSLLDLKVFKNSIFMYWIFSFCILYLVYIILGIVDLYTKSKLIKKD